jgi:hypothetical protein
MLLEGVNIQVFALLIPISPSTMLEEVSESHESQPIATWVVYEGFPMSSLSYGSGLTTCMEISLPSNS